MNGDDIPVYIRNVDETDRFFFGRFAQDDLDDLVRKFILWGCLLDGEDVTNEAVGQFFLSPEKAGFEILVGVA